MWDDLTTAVVGCRVRGEKYTHVDLEPDRIASDLNVTFFQDVEQADLHQLIEFGEFIHRENTAVHPRNKAEMQCIFSAHRYSRYEFCRIDLADHIGELGARGKPLRISLVAVPPLNRHVSLFSSLQKCSGHLRDRAVRIFMHRAAGNVEIGNFRI